MVVQLNDVIEIPASGWGDTIEIHWQQSMRQKSAKYYQVPFTNTTSKSSIADEPNVRQLTFM
jgi:hypothetical protein